MVCCTVPQYVFSSSLFNVAGCSVLSPHCKKYFEILKNVWGNKAGKGSGAQDLCGMAEVVRVFILEKKKLIGGPYCSL